MSEITLEQIIREGYGLKAAPTDAWRSYDERSPMPGYFDFDWLSARHPDLYHRFALSSVGLVQELNRITDLTGLKVIEVGAGTGRASIEIARKARSVTAVDIYESVVHFGKDRVRQSGLSNVAYVRADCANLPFSDSTFDALINCWAILDFSEAYRVLKPGGRLFQLGPAPGALCGELTAMLANLFPQVITEIAPAEQFDSDYPDADFAIQDDTWNGLPVTPPTLLHDFTYTSEYGDYREAAAIYGRLYGPDVRQYLLDRKQASVTSRLRIGIARVKK